MVFIEDFHIFATECRVASSVLRFKGNNMCIEILQIDNLTTCLFRIRVRLRNAFRCFIYVLCVAHIRCLRLWFMSEVDSTLCVVINRCTLLCEAKREVCIGYRVSISWKIVICTECFEREGVKVLLILK